MVKHPTNGTTGTSSCPTRKNASGDRPLPQIRLKVQIRFRACKFFERAFQGDKGGQIRRGVLPQALRTYRTGPQD